jgi:hypothetical protein
LPFSAGARQFAEIFGTIDIPRNPRQFEHDTRQTRRFRRGQVRQKAIVAEAQREEIAGDRQAAFVPRPAASGTSTAPRGGALSTIFLQFGTSIKEYPLEPPACCSPSLSANRRRHFDGVGLSGVVVGDDLEIETRRQLARKPNRSSPPQRRPALPVRERLQYVFAHCLRQREAFFGAQDGRQPLLGVRKILYRHQNHARSSQHLSGRRLHRRIEYALGQRDSIFRLAHDGRSAMHAHAGLAQGLVSAASRVLESTTSRSRKS